jgi:hypothetical protein
VAQSEAGGAGSKGNSYALLNSPKATEEDIENEVERIASGLFSVIVTLGTSWPCFRLCLFSHFLDRTSTVYSLS